jgi:hypothetical protein
VAAYLLQLEIFCRKEAQMQQDNKPDNKTFPSLGNTDPRHTKKQDRRENEISRKTGEAPPETAQRGKQPSNPNFEKK